MKEFFEAWTHEEIDEYLQDFNVLILFKADIYATNVKIDVYGNLTDDQRDKLKHSIMNTFGGALLNESLCNKINEFAQKWYNKNVLNKRSRVINFKKDKK